MSSVETASPARNDAVAKVTGRAKYADDLKFYGMLHAVPVYTDEVHARILEIDAEKAIQAPGVIRVICARDIPGAQKYGQIQQDYALLASDRIRMHGDVVALVVAETREQALAALLLIDVKTEALPLLTDPEEARKDRILIHEDKGSNIVVHHKIRRGDPGHDLEASDIILERDYSTQRIEHAYMEPESAVAVPRDDGVMEIYGSVQHPFTARRFTAAILGRKLNDVEIRGIYSGGGFGGKDDTASIVCARAALAAQLCGRPVKLTYDREWSMRESYKRHPYTLKYRMGLSRDGHIRAVEVDMLADAGAYASMTPFVLWRSTVQCCGPYRVPSVRADVRGVHTNNVFTGAMRGFGSPQVNFAVEQLVEEAAETLGMNELEFRRLNMLRQGDESITGQILDGHTVALEQVLDKIVRGFDYEEKVRKSSFGNGDGEEMYGAGLALSYRGMSLGAEGMDFVTAIINVQFDGSILIEVGVHENGQGAETAMISIVEKELGVSRSRIRYNRLSTSVIPDGGATVASRATLMGGGAAAIAARNLKELIYRTLSDRFYCSFEQMEFRGDRIYFGSESLSFDEMVEEMYLHQTHPYATGTFQAPKVDWDEESGRGNAYFTWVYGCQAVELTVNRKTGKITLLNALAAHDIGEVIHRDMLLGQIYGGMVMGMGYALKEDLRSEDGKVKDLNLNTYRLMRAKDIPDMDTLLVTNHDPLSPTGAKGIGEPALEITAPAIANAVYRATGQRLRSLPLKVELRR